GTTCRSPKRTILLLSALAALTLSVVPVAAALARRHARVPHLTSVGCWPAKACGSNPHVVSPGGKLRFRGRNLEAGMVALFPRWRPVKGTSATVSARLRKRSGFVATVPPSARSGRIRIVARNGRRSNAVGPIRIVRSVQRLQQAFET